MSQEPIWIDYGDEYLHLLTFPRGGDYVWPNISASACRLHRSAPLRAFLQRQLDPSVKLCQACLEGRRILGPRSKHSARVIDNSRLRKAVAQSGLSFEVIAARIGKDESLVRRALGAPKYKLRSNGRRYGPYAQRRIAETTAVLIARAIHLDPRDIDL